MESAGSERADQLARDAKRREREAKIANAKYTLAKDLGRNYRQCTLENFTLYDEPEEAAKQRAVLEKLRSISVPDHVRDGCGLLLFGPPGTGKDHLAVAMLKEAAKAGLTARWVNCQTLFSDIRAGFHGGTSEAELKAKLAAVDVLCLSDPYIPGDTDFNMLTLYDLVNRRNIQCKSTWATLNVFDRNEAIEKLGPQQFSRLRDRALTVKCYWPDYRERR